MITEVCVGLCSPVQLGERNVSALALVGLEVNTGFQPIHLKSLQDHTLGIQLWKPTEMEFLCKKNALQGS